jgi:hypothetical protein
LPAKKNYAGVPFSKQKNAAHPASKKTPLPPIPAWEKQNTPNPNTAASRRHCLTASRRRPSRAASRRRRRPSRTTSRRRPSRTASRRRLDATFQVAAGQTPSSKSPPARRHHNAAARSPASCHHPAIPTLQLSWYYPRTRRPAGDSPTTPAAALVVALLCFEMLIRTACFAGLWPVAAFMVLSPKS